MRPPNRTETPRTLEKCPRCFAELFEPWQFCPSCGLPLDPALTSNTEVTSTSISYVQRAPESQGRHRPSLSESLVQSGLHLLVLMAFVGIVTGGLLVLSPGLLRGLTKPASIETTTPEPILPPVLSGGAYSSVDIEFVPIPGGQFLTGDPLTWPDDARALLRAILDPRYKAQWAGRWRALLTVVGSPLAPGTSVAFLSILQVLPTTSGPEIEVSDKEAERIRAHISPEVKAFEVSKYEVTNYQFYEYLDWVRDTRRESKEVARWEAKEGPARDWEDTDWEDFPKPHPTQYDVPVRGVTFKEAAAFAKWLGQQTGRVVRLPYWYEWEKAARGEHGWNYPWGDDWDPNRCNTKALARGQPIPAGFFGETAREDLRDESPYGVFNMAGNVSEWVESHLDSPTKWVMGGGYDGDEYWAQTWVKSDQLPTFSARYIGFRLVREIE